MANISKIYAKLSALKDAKSPVKLGKIDDLIDQMERLSDEVDSISLNVSELVGTALSDAQELDRLQDQLEALYQEAMQTQVDIEEIGLDVPQNLIDASEKAQGIVDAPIGTLINALNECERVLYTGA
jgi:ABC-type transporter Mla subunit MlaD